jgi:NDP-4-keto-2,6-dideoxyhexose 3-C-methyltransferase
MRTHMKATVAKDGTMTVSEAAPNTVSKKRTTCRSCGGALEPVISIGDQYLVRFVKDVDMTLPRSPINLVRCPDCGLLQLEHTVEPDLLYKEFWYRSGMNQTMRDALEDVVKTGLRYHHVGRWLDIGANDGYLLSQVPPGFVKIACEPALNFVPELDEIADHVIPTYFTADHDCLRNGTGKGTCDVITSAAMFYDLDDPNRFVQDIAKALSPDGVWINQLNDSPTMLDKTAFDALCHEHLCYYDVHSLNALYERNGLVILGITYNDVNGGSIRVVAEKAVARTRAMILHDHRRVSARDAEMFAGRVSKWKNNMTNLVTGSLAYSSRLWLYGASTKGCVLLQYLDLNEAFCGIADRNPLKLGLRMGGTWIPVRHEDEMRAERPKHVMALPWAFRNEFVVREKAMLEDGTTMIFPLPTIEFVG